MTTTIRLGISTCPNDTFAFHGLLNRQVDWRGLNFEVELLDIQELNERLFAERFDVAKTSFHAALLLSKDWTVLPSGSAIGFGVGPLLLSSRQQMTPSSKSQITLCPGQHTTATLLFKLFYPDTTEIRQTVFSDIMQQLQKGSAEFGVCIHEGRFTWQDQQLGLVEDLGTRWETETQTPLPLGGIVAGRHLSQDVIATVQSVIHDSLQFAMSEPDSAMPTMRKFAQEFSDEVLMQHVKLYVNDWTIDLGDVGRTALRELSNRAIQIGLLSSASARLEVFTA